MKKILVGIPFKNHIDLAKDEIEGFANLGYICETFVYNRNNSSLGVFKKLYGVLSTAYRLVGYLKRFRPDILYLNSRFEPIGSIRDFLTLLIIGVFIKNKPKVVIKSHGSNFDIFEKKSLFYKKLILPFLIDQVDIWWFLSNDEKRIIESYSLKMNKKTIVIPNIIDPRRSVFSSSFLEKYNIPKDKFTFLFVGRMVREKGVFSIIQSIPKFKNRDNCVFICVGEGHDLESLKSLSKELKVEKYICFLGFIEEAECDHFYANTDALVFPSHDEGFAMTLFKSVASGMPIITTRLRAAKDYLSEPENTLWVDIGSDESLANALIKLYEGKDLRDVMSKNNRVLGEEFSKMKVAQLMSDAFSKLL